MAHLTQKVVIPKGLVNPNETTIVEIPVNLQHVNTVIARPKQDWSYGINRHLGSSTESSPEPSRVQPKVIRKRSYTRRSFPGTKPRQWHTGDGGTTFGGRPWEPESSADESGFQPYIPKPPRTPRVPEYKSFVREHKVDAQSSMQGLDSFEGSLYRDFRPGKGRSSPLPLPQSFGYTPPSMRKYLSVSPQSDMSSSAAYSGGGYSASGSSGAYPHPANICKTSITTTSPNEITTEEFTEESWPDESQLSSIHTGSPSTSHSGRPMTDSSSPGRSPLAVGDTSGSSGGNMTQGDLMNSLGELESSELQKIMGDLSSFQNARRKLVFDASSLASASDVSKEILHYSV